MGAELKVYEEVGCANETEVRYRNVILAALTGAAVIPKPDQDAGNAIGDEYTLDIAYDVAHSQWDCDVTRVDGSQYHIDGITTNGDNDGNIIAGVTVSIASLLTQNVYQSIVNVGYNPGIIVAGSNSADKHLWVKNIGSTDGTDARIVILPDANFQNTLNTPLKALDESRLTKTVPLGVYELTVKADTSKVDVEYEGNPPYEIDIVHDGSTPSQIADGLWAIFSSSIAQGDTATIDASDGKNRLRIATDAGGSPATFGTADVLLGNISINEIKSFWVRVETSTADVPEGNPRRANLQARITTI